MKSDIKSFFSSLSASSRQQRKQAYEHLIAVEKGIVPFKGAKMPWMLPAWENGLQMLNEVIEEVDNIKASTTTLQGDSKLLTAAGGCQAHRS
jgi:hypothetical protein